MDYETVKIENPFNPPCGCYVSCPDEIGWDCGEQRDIQLPVFGQIFIGNTEDYFTPADFLEGSSTKYAKMVLQNFRGEVVDTQIAKAIPDFEYSDDGTATCYYEVDEDLSKKLRAGVYSLYVYLMDTLPASDGKPERTIFSLMVTKPEGIKITIS